MNKKSLYAGRVSAVILTALVCLLWGSLYPMISLGNRYFAIDGGDIGAVMLFAGVRFLICGAILVGFVTVRQKRFFSPTKGAFPVMAVISLLTIILHYAFTYIGIATCDPAKVALLKHIGFLFITGFAFLFRKEDTFSLAKVFCGILGFLGIIVINLDGMTLSFGMGEMLIILASFSGMAGNVVSKNAFDKHDPTYMVAHSQLFGGVVLTAAGLVLGGRINAINWQGCLVLLYICAASIGAYVMWNKLVKYQDISKLSIIKVLEPLFAVVLTGVLLGTDIFKIPYLVSAAMMLAAILLSHLPGKNKATSADKRERPAS